MINVPGLGAGLSEPGEPEGKGAGGRLLADQLTLSQPGVQVMPTTLPRAPLQICRPSYGLGEFLISNREQKST